MDFEVYTYRELAYSVIVNSVLWCETTQLELYARKLRVALLQHSIYFYSKTCVISIAFNF